MNHSTLDYWLVTRKPNCWLIPRSKVIMLVTTENYTSVYFGNHHVVIRKTLAECAKILSAGTKAFFQVNRSCIINLAFIRHISFAGRAGRKRRFQLLMDNHKRVVMSRIHSRQFKRMNPFIGPKLCDA